MSLKSHLLKNPVYLVDGKRTPFGKFGGSLKDISPVDLAVIPTKKVLKDLKIEPSSIDHFILGNVVPTTSDTVYGGRHLALKCGANVETPGYNVNRLCGSGIQSILDAVNRILINGENAIIAAGVENMSNVPHLIYGQRFGVKFGNTEVVDMLMDALTDKNSNTPMGITAENLAKKYNISRDECEILALESINRANMAYSKGLLQDELVEVTLKKGILTKDEHLRESIELKDIQKLRPSFIKNGVVTAATASGIVDGAASTLIASEKFIKDNNLKPLARIIDGSIVGVDPTIMGIGPVPAIRNILNNNNFSVEDIDLFEINEAFASQVLACLKELPIDQNKLNIWGGSLALGHPLGATGTRIALTLARQLKYVNKKRGIASACIGGGQGISLLIENCN